MPSCVLRYCKNSSVNCNKAAGITFHRFLQLDNPKREKWIKFVQNDRSENTWLPSKHSYICSAHFKVDDFCTTKAGRRFLKKTAVPCDDPFKQTDEDLRASPTSLDNDFVSDSESIFDSPQEIKLKKDLNKALKAKIMLSKKIKKVQRQNRILKKKNDSLIAIIKEFRERQQNWLSAICQATSEENDMSPQPLSDTAIGAQASPERNEASVLDNRLLSNEPESTF